MKTDEREVLTKESIAQKLSIEQKHAEIMFYLTCGLPIITAIVLVAFIVNVPEWEYKAAFGAGLLFVVGVSVKIITDSIKKRRVISQMNFIIEKDVVFRIVEDEHRRRPKMERLAKGNNLRHVWEDVIYFKDRGRVVCDKTICRCSNPGDEYYFVISRYNYEMLAMYSAREYCLEDESLLD